jgi:hypothetical protein
MAITSAVSGQPTKNNGATILQAGNIDGKNVTNSLLVSQNASTARNGSYAVESATANLGTIKAISGGRFANLMRAGQFIVKTLTGQSIAGVSLPGVGVISTSGPVNTPPALHRWSRYFRLDITSWNYLTGAATFGGGSGNAVFLAAVDGTEVNSANSQTIDKAANTSMAVPGNLVYLTTGLLATVDSYEPR